MLSEEVAEVVVERDAELQAVVEAPPWRSEGVGTPLPLAPAPGEALRAGLVLEEAEPKVLRDSSALRDALPEKELQGEEEAPPEEVREGSGEREAKMPLSVGACGEGVPVREARATLALKVVVVVSEGEERAVTDAEAQLLLLRRKLKLSRVDRLADGEGLSEAVGRGEWEGVRVASAEIVIKREAVEEAQGVPKSRETEGQGEDEPPPPLPLLGLAQGDAVSPSKLTVGAPVPLAAAEPLPGAEALPAPHTPAKDSEALAEGATAVSEGSAVPVPMSPPQLAVAPPVGEAAPGSEAVAPPVPLAGPEALPLSHPEWERSGVAVPEAPVAVAVPPPPVEGDAVNEKLPDKEVQPLAEAKPAVAVAGRPVPLPHKPLLPLPLELPLLLPLRAKEAEADRVTEGLRAEDKEERGDGDTVGVVVEERDTEALREGSSEVVGAPVNEAKGDEEGVARGVRDSVGEPLALLDRDGEGDAEMERSAEGEARGEEDAVPATALAVATPAEGDAAAFKDIEERGERVAAPGGEAL